MLEIAGLTQMDFSVENVSFGAFSDLEDRKNISVRFYVKKSLKSF